jgi:hypothetical protein
VFGTRPDLGHSPVDRGEEDDGGATARIATPVAGGAVSRSLRGARTMNQTAPPVADAGVPPREGAGRVGPLVAITAVAAVLTLLALRSMGTERVAPDFIQFWAAARLLADGRSPYDVAGQTRIQQGLIREKAQDELGIKTLLPYYYPPWLGLSLVPLLPCGYRGAKGVWLFLNIGVLLHAGSLLRRAVAGVPGTLPLVVVPTFALSVRAILMGQTSPLILFLTALTWSLMQRGHDRRAGAALAGLTIKPQLTMLLIVAILLWSARQGRRGVVVGFLATLTLLAVAGAMVVPSWPILMLRAPAETPLPSEPFPWIGVSWLLVLRTLGLRSWSLWTLDAAVAVPVVVAVLRAALRRTTALGDLVAMSLLAVPFFAPYCQIYDLPILLIPCLVLLGGRLPEAAGAALVVVLIVVPYPHLVLIDRFRFGSLPPEPPPYVTFFWLPLLVGGAWLATARRSRGDRDDRSAVTAARDPDPLPGGARGPEGTAVPRGEDLR